VDEKHKKTSLKSEKEVGEDMRLVFMKNVMQVGDGWNWFRVESNSGPQPSGFTTKDRIVIT
jgi:hypothetical protein